VVSFAQGTWKLSKTRTVLFLDEIHRFNKSQQDALLPHVETGLLILLGATTENPSFSLNSALLSRCRVMTMEKLSKENVMSILERALLDKDNGLGNLCVKVNKDALQFIVGVADGDARCALNALQLACNAVAENQTDGVNLQLAKEVMQRTHVLYDRAGDQHYNVISALHKSIRGSDVDASLYWLARMLEGGEDPRFVTRRLIRLASEDIGLAEPRALEQAVAAHHAVQHIGMPEGNVVLAQAVSFMALAPKSTAVYKAYKAAAAIVRSESNDPVPLHITNAPTGLMKACGYGAGYIYPPDHGYPRKPQQYLPASVQKRVDDAPFYDRTDASRNPIALGFFADEHNGTNSSSARGTKRENDQGTSAHINNPSHHRA
jgi:putative ATPase